MMATVHSLAWCIPLILYTEDSAKITSSFESIFCKVALVSFQAAGPRPINEFNVDLQDKKEKKKLVEK